jgi:hypothetical protein
MVVLKRIKTAEYHFQIPMLLGYKYFGQNNWRKFWRFTQNTAINAEEIIITLFFMKNDIYLPKI